MKSVHSRKEGGDKTPGHVVQWATLTEVGEQVSHLFIHLRREIRTGGERGYMKRRPD